MEASVLVDPSGNAQADYLTGSQMGIRYLIQHIGGLLGDPTSSHAEINGQINQLQAMLQSHFSRAFHDTFYEETVFEAPWLTPQTECLRQQQKSLNEILDDLNRDSSIRADSKYWRQRVRVQFKIFADLFFEHDAGVQSLMHTKNGWD